MSSRPRKLLVAITAHGFGHATRTQEVVKELRRLRPDLEIVISSAVPERFFQDRVGTRVLHRHQHYEPGTVQKSCFEVDREATRKAYEQHRLERPAMLRSEIDYIRREDFSGLLADIPALPLEAAHRVGIPSAAIWNFTWDWILEPILRPGHDGATSFSDLLAELRAAYGRAGLHLKLPFSPVKASLAGVEAAPLVGRRSMVSREVTLERIGFDPTDPRPLVLVAMGGWDCSSWKPVVVKGAPGFRFLVVGKVPLDVRTALRTIPTELEPGYTFFDLVRAADVVLSKPGYGIASECVVNRTPLLGVERRDFLEIPELLRDLNELGPFVEISLADFFAGRWENSLRSILECPRPWKPIPENGAREIAERLCSFFNL